MFLATSFSLFRARNPPRGRGDTTGASFVPPSAIQLFNSTTAIITAVAADEKSHRNEARSILEKIRASRLDDAPSLFD